MPPGALCVLFLHLKENKMLIIRLKGIIALASCKYQAHG